MGTRWGIGFILGALVVLAPAIGLTTQAGEPVAVLTELKIGQGTLQVKLAAEADWKLPLPLLSLRVGDQIRATQNATAVLLFTGGQGTLTVSAANSPYVLQAPPGGPPSGRMDLVAGLSRILMGKKKELTYVPLAVRGPQQPPLLLSPRDGNLLGAPTLEWAGSDRLRYTVRILGPQGVIWGQANLRRAPLPYPPSARPLVPGVRHRWELEAPGYPPQRGHFTILPPAEIARIRDTLRSLEPAVLPGYPRNTVALIRAGFLFEQGLYVETRKELQGAIAADPDEPSLHLVLGELYERLGLAELAAVEFDEAQFLTTASGPPRKP